MGTRMIALLWILVVCSEHFGNAKVLNKNANDVLDVRVPAEWRVRQSGTWMGWPIFETLPGKPVAEVFLEMMAYITQGNATDLESDFVYLAVTDASQESLAKDEIRKYNSQALVSGGRRPLIVESRVKYYNIPRSDFWFRDYLLFGWITNSEGSSSLAVVDYDFNAWGMGGEYIVLPKTTSSLPTFSRVSNYFNSISNIDTQISPKVAFNLGATSVKSWLRAEPGGFEYNDGFDATSPSRGGGNAQQSLSRRRLIVSEAYLTQPEHNYGVTLYQILDELERIYSSLDDIIVLPKFRFNETLGREVMETPCPTSIDVVNSNLGRWGHCLDPTSSYYTDTFGGGVVVDDSAFSGTIDNEDNPERRRLLGFSDPIYNNVITPLTTNGHTDEYVRWVGENKVLLAYVPNGSFANPRSLDGRTWFRLEKIKETLIAKGIEIVPVPVPREYVEYIGAGYCAYDSILDMTFTGGTYYDPIARRRVPAKGVPILSIYPKGSKIPFYSARSYLNFVVTDKYVLMPRYGDDEQRDREAFQTLKRVFENEVASLTGIRRTVVQLDNVDRINFCGGGMHCITQQQPLLPFA